MRLAERRVRSAAMSRALGALAIALFAAGCASFAPPRAWERGDLAKPAMQFDPDALDAKIEQHVYTSKEGAAGGFGVGGGGCGCN